MKRIDFVAAMLLLLIGIFFVGMCVLPWTHDRHISKSNGFRLGTCGHLAETYFRRPVQQTIDEFATYDLQRRYEIYICGNQYIEPPAIELVGPFAAGGAPVAVFLTNRLKESNDGATIRDIVMVFVEMKRQGSYDVAADAELQSLMEEKIQGISDEFWRVYLTRAVAMLGPR